MSQPAYLLELRSNSSLRSPLVFFHHAGGSAQSFRPLLAELPHSRDVYAVELPGRGSRFDEPPPQSLAAEVDAISRAIVGRFSPKYPPILVGHSLGAIIAFEVAINLQRQRITPACVVVSGVSAPHLREQRAWHRLDDDELVEQLRDLGGTPPQILEHTELLELFLPVIRADLELAETYVPTQGSSLRCPLAAVGGKNDTELSERKLAGWTRYTQAAFTLQWFPGDHFYLSNSDSEFVAWLQRHVLETMS